MSQGRKVLGASGEDLVAKWYEANGYQVIGRNWRDGRSGEVDLIVQRGSLLVFCEVKTRTSEVAFGGPLAAVTRAKQLRIRRLAAAWLRELQRAPQSAPQSAPQRAPQSAPQRAAEQAAQPRVSAVRFDVAAVCGAEINVVEGAF